MNIFFDSFRYKVLILPDIKSSVEVSNTKVRYIVPSSYSPPSIIRSNILTETKTLKFQTDVMPNQNTASKHLYLYDWFMAKNLIPSQYNNKVATITNGQYAYSLAKAFLPTSPEH